MPTCAACQVEGSGTVCAWCGRTYEAAASKVRAAGQRRAAWRWILAGVAAAAVIGFVVVPSGPSPSAMRAFERALPGLMGRIESEKHTCRWTVTDANQVGREGWRIVQCRMDGGDTGPSWYLARTDKVYAHNAAAKVWSKAPEPPEIPAWSRPGVACSMSDYYDDCMAGIVADKVRRVSGQGVDALQAIADQSLSFPAGHSRDVAAKVKACGVTSLEARCGQFTREMRVVEAEVSRQLAAQRSQ